MNVCTFILLPLPSNFCLVNKSSSAFKIPFAGLKQGTHEFEFEVDKSFFEGIDYSLISDGKVHVILQLEKKETMMIGEFTVEGSVNTTCDRCNDPLELPIKGAYRIVYKFGEEISDDENLIVLPDESYELDIAPQVYEFMCVSLPSRLLHKPGECNEEMMALYNQHIVNAGGPEGDEDDEDWDEDDEDNDRDDDEGDWEDGDEDDEEDEDPDDDDGSDRPIDPRWSVLKNLN